MPPAFVLSQDQTLRKYLRSAFSKLFCSLKNCSVALFLKHWIYFAWLFNFQRTPAASRRQLIYITTDRLSLSRTFFKFFKRFACWVLVTLAPTRMYYTRTFSLRQPLFSSFFAFSFLFLGFVFFFLLFFRSLFIFPTFWY